MSGTGTPAAAFFAPMFNPAGQPACHSSAGTPPAGAWRAAVSVVRAVVLGAVLGGLLQGCVTTVYQPEPLPPTASLPTRKIPIPLPTPEPITRDQDIEPLGGEIAMRAVSLLGRPYQWGGNGPEAFDCSGLVRYVHQQLGINVPRTAADQFSAAQPVKVGELQPGDLLFFRLESRRISHVAIYAGEGRFVHAPQSGRSVELRTLDDRFYRPRLVGAGRLF